MIGIVDYNAGNIKSVERALSYIGTPYVLSKNPKDLEKVDKVIFPGVGEAKYAMEQLHETGFYSFLKDFAKSGKPLLGICLGSQIIFDHSEEGDVDCLGIVPGIIQHFSTVFEKQGKDMATYKGLKIPHMGWNNLQFHKESSLFQEVEKEASFYFVHSYMIQPQDNSIVVASADYGVLVPSVITWKNISACQFHPEKSAKAGLQILRNFVQNQDGKLC